MEKLNQYRNIIKKILTEYDKLASQTPNPEGVDIVLAFDEKRDQYLWFQAGWYDDRKIREMSLRESDMLSSFEITNLKSDPSNPIAKPC